MQWIKGRLLNSFVSNLVGRQDRSSLQKLASDWRVMLEKLEVANIAHGDLQHGNVLVEPTGALRLVDYDGMFVPALAGQQSTEQGQPSYQHPSRNKTHFGLGLDRFAGLAIYTALLALAVKPDLWARFDNEDNILFTPDDLRDPGASSIFEQLYAINDLNVVSHAHALATAVSGSPLSAPRLSEIPKLTSRPTRPAHRHQTNGTRPAGRPNGKLPSWVADQLGRPEAAAAGETGNLVPLWSSPRLETRHWVEQEPVFGIQQQLVYREVRKGIFRRKRCWRHRCLRTRWRRLLGTGRHRSVGMFTSGSGSCRRCRG